MLFKGGNGLFKSDVALNFFFFFHKKKALIGNVLLLALYYFTFAFGSCALWCMRGLILRLG